MLKKLKRKIVLLNLTCMATLLIITSVISCFLNFYAKKNDVMNSIQMEIGVVPPFDEKSQKDTKNQTRVLLCSVVYNQISKNYSVINNEFNIEENVLSESVNYIIDNAEPSGIVKKYNLLYRKEEGVNNEFKIIIADANYPIASTLTLALTLLGVIIVFLLFLYFVSAYLAKIAIKPVEKAWQEQKRFVADASHELKTPLTVILANNNILLSDETKTVCQQKKWIESTQEEATQMKDMIGDLLTLVQNEKNDNSTLFTEVNLSKLAIGVYLQFEGVSYEKDIELISLINDDIYINGDKKKLKQLIIILIDNAIKYENMKGKVEVKLIKTKGKIYFSVKNYNSIITQKDLPHVFDRFYRCDMSRNTDGTGLGLSIAKSIVDMHNGEIEVFSNINQGTIFNVTFK